MRVLFVCLGNICRSPTAEGVMRGLVSEAGLDGEIEAESAGTAGWHIGEPADGRAIAAAAARGVTLDSRGRQVIAGDFDAFDLLIGMDRSNRDRLLELAPDDEAQEKVKLLRQYADGPELDVPDPYYGGDDGFEEVLDIVDRNCRALLAELQAAV